MQTEHKENYQKKKKKMSWGVKWNMKSEGSG